MVSTMSIQNNLNSPKCIRECQDACNILKGLSRQRYENLQITLEIKKSNIQSQHVPFFSQKSHNFDRKMPFHEIAFLGTECCFFP